MFLPAFVCLSVCEQDYSKKFAWIWMKCCVLTDVGTWTNWLTFEADPDYSPDAGTGLLSPISFALQRGILLRRENPTYMYWAPVAAAKRGFKWFYSPRAVGTTLSDVHALHRVPALANISSKSWGNIASYVCDELLQTKECTMEQRFNYKGKLNTYHSLLNRSMAIVVVVDPCIVGPS